MEYTVVAREDLSPEDSQLLESAQKAKDNAYAPYSNFYVGAALRLRNNEVVQGSNQENASFPAGLCAEKVGLSAASSLFPNVAVEKIAISTSKDDHMLTAPCGICRQSLVEYEERFGQKIAIILCNGDDVYIFASAKDLLPFSFDKKALD
ncbi:MAG: cytidine deaminase [Bacteroidia bacterium]|nr:cytidine deaminase [Bacteroidia bacterium]